MPTKIVHWSAMLLLSFGVTVTYLVYQLKPATDGFMSTQEPLLKNTSTFVATPHTERPQQTIHERLTQSEQAKPADDANTVDNADAMATAFVLNQLLADYFTTDFDLPTQTKWQQQLDAGTPFLAELANYLKLNNLFDIDLHFDENRLYTSQLILKLNPETGESYESNRIYNLFTFMDTYGKNLWPMKLINAAKSNSYTPKILLNNYDRDFVLKIERQNLAQQLSPLALGIERLLRFHLLTSISNSSGLQTYFRTKNIDTVETEFTKAEPNTKDTFHLYNLLIQQRWQEAVLFMQSASHLNSSDNLFFYDILAINAPEALLSNVNYDQYSRQAAWWDRFFQYELCISSRAHYQTIINERLSITLPCTTAQPTNIPALYLDANVDLVMESFWQHILNNPTLTDRKSTRLNSSH